MRLRPRHVALGAVGLAVGVFGVGALREATLSTHHPVAAGSESTVLVRAEQKGEEPGQTLAEMVDAQLSMCRLEVSSDLVGPVEDLGDGTFEAVFAPAMDETNRRQFRGCVEDWTTDHLRVDVLEIGAVDPGDDDD
jgi:hypothetical protein